MSKKNLSFNFDNASMNEIPGFLFIDHVAISVCEGELESQIKNYQLMGFKVLHREEIMGKDLVREVLLQIGESPNLIQLIEPLSPESPVQKQIDKNQGRGGLVHVGLRVKNAKQAFDCFKENNFRIIDDEPRQGSRGTTVFFIHPKSHNVSPLGILYEVVEDQRDVF